MFSMNLEKMLSYYSMLEMTINKYQLYYVGVFILNAVAKVLTFVSLRPNCDLALVPSLSISFCSAAETEINSGPLSHRILDNCLS